MALTPSVVTEMANTMKYGGGSLINFSPSSHSKTVSGDVTAFHRIIVENVEKNVHHISTFVC